MSLEDKALGDAIRELRAAAAISQVQLGETAYKAGAGVSMSRVERGLMRPSDDKLELLVAKLGCTRVELDTLVATKLAALQVQSGHSPRKQMPTKQRLEAVQQTVGRRTKLITEKGEAYNAAYDQARDDFFRPFIDTALTIKGAPDPPELPATEEASADPATSAQLRLQLNSNTIAIGLATAGGAAAGAAAGGAAAYATFTATAMLGTASTGAAISGLSGVAATNATLAALGGGTLAAGGAGVAGGTMLLAGIVAGPALLLAAGGVAWMVRRNRAKEAELRSQLDDAEDQLAATERGFHGLIETLDRAEQILAYIATHAAHAHRRWAAALPKSDAGDDGAVLWESLSRAQKDSYQSLISAAGSQLTAASIDEEAYMTASGVELESLIELTDHVLIQADQALRAAV